MFASRIFSKRRSSAGSVLSVWSSVAGVLPPWDGLGIKGAPGVQRFAALLRPSHPALHGSRGDRAQQLAGEDYRSRGDHAAMRA
jgi:hypothetical protein